MFGGPLSDPKFSGSGPSNYDSPDIKSRRKSFEGKAEDVVYEIDRSLKEKKEEKKALSPVAVKRNPIELKAQKTLEKQKSNLDKSGFL